MRCTRLLSCISLDKWPDVLRGAYAGEDVALTFSLRNRQDIAPDDFQLSPSAADLCANFGCVWSTRMQCLRNADIRWLDFKRLNNLERYAAFLISTWKFLWSTIAPILGFLFRGAQERCLYSFTVIHRISWFNPSLEMPRLGRVRFLGQNHALLKINRRARE